MSEVNCMIEAIHQYILKDQGQINKTYLSYVQCLSYLQYLIYLQKIQLKIFLSRPRLMRKKLHIKLTKKVI